MKAIAAITAIVAVSWALCGCGGSGTTPYVPMKGSYSGTWSSAGLGVNGTMTIVVAADGTVTGTATEAVPYRTDGSVSAQILYDGTCNGTWQFGSDTPVIFTGTLHRVSGHLTGTLTQYVAGQGDALVVDLAPQ